MQLLQTLVRLADADAATVSKVPVCSLPKWFESHQFFFVIPTLPSRAQFKCMRGGGPATVDNPDPKCASSKV